MYRYRSCVLRLQILFPVLSFALAILKMQVQFLAPRHQQKAAVETSSLLKSDQQLNNGLDDDL